MSTESSPHVARGNNTTFSSANLNAQSDTGTTPARGPRKPHEHIRTSDEELKTFNKNYYAKAQSQYMDPCREQTKASMKCMDENNYDKRRCTRFFKDYADCKKKWMESLREERRKRNLGIVDDDEVSGIKMDTAPTDKPSS
ncbi:hypothetical protein BC939DRAFT_460195 [Gamsiella multidivaricata]|uniref:uncharacterized protein n=1 Tax=Gamsiella multidivaricata TaxID=101098 RepID=UPI002220704A|nr:uncharacterized protein BC939DRAFT_460195 [Gamsiella multidivaricata]KAG0364096.1 Mitochondrial copper homeostasis protein [Gamsiella multidivaricata]KAI7819421.1 hypothetical protein BC939DRAFT_460195 [Gamsiella multidivaricata]